MKFEKASLNGTILALFLAIIFTIWGISLVISANRLQEDIRKCVSLITEFSNLKISIRSLEYGVKGEQQSLEIDSTLTSWKQQYSDYDHSQNSLLGTIDQASAEIKDQLFRIDASVEKMKAIYTRTLHSDEIYLANNSGVLEFHREMKIAISLVEKVSDKLKERLGSLSHSLTKKWRFLNVIVFVSCLLAIFLSLILYTHQKDSTKRKRTEKALFRITAEFRAIFKSIPDAVVFTDTNNEIIMVNPAFSSLFGYKPEEVMGKKANILFANQHSTNGQNKNPDHFEKPEQSKPYEILCRRKNKKTFISETLTTQVNDDRNQPFGIFNIVRDVSKRKAAERALKEARSKLEIRVNERTEDLVRANEEIKRFAYIVSHDLRAPLVNIKGFSSELREAFVLLNSKLSDLLTCLPEESKEEVSDLIQEEIPEALQFIDSSATRMGNLIDAVLKLSRFGRRELHFERINVRVVIQKLLNSLAHQIDQKEVKVQINSLPRVVADRTSLEQILGNLLGNAIKYLDPSRPGEIEISGENRQFETIFCIRDNGQGIAEEDIERIFEPFSRFGSQNVPGEGMGLAYVLKLVRRHGGKIWCQSELGAGTTISFSLSNKTVQEMEQIRVT